MRKNNRSLFASTTRSETKEVPPWYVITGGVCCGKSTLLEELGRLGFHTVEETARVWIEDEIKKGHTAEEIRKDERQFQQELLNRKLRVENEAPVNQIAFFERAVPDSVPYFSLCGLPTDEVLAISTMRYQKVFFCEALEFESDLVRTETEAEAKQIDLLTRETYEQLGYTTIYLPAVSVAARLETVLQHVRG